MWSARSNWIPGVVTRREAVMKHFSRDASHLRPRRNNSDEAMHRRYNRWHMRFDQPDPYGGYDMTNPQSIQPV